jgi:signal transduction histidine kinase
MNGTILCVDDDPSVLVALRAVLGKMGDDFSVEIAEDGAEALEIEEELRERGRELAVVISDFIMPGIRGDDLLVQFHARNPDTVKIMLTGQSEFEGVKKAINHANLYRFLEKPFNNDDILLTVKSAFTAYHAARELRRQNEALKTLNSELEDMVQMLNNKREELTRSEAKATISTLVASVSHELGTPLGNSVMSAEMLTGLITKTRRLLDSGQIMKSDLEMFFDEALESGEILQKNLARARDLLQNFKQVAADQASEQRRVFDLAATMQEILATMAPSLRTLSHRVEIEIPAGINMDSLPGALGQVIINLINNAYLHAFDGRENGLVTIRATMQDDYVRLQVQDNGVGIADPDLARLTQPFFSTKIGRGGTGLGMSIVDNLVSKSLGGTLGVQSQLGVGTTFTIEMPRVSPF